MNSFEAALSRLKHALRVSNDTEVASALGMSKTAFAERKRRGSFPDRQLLALAAARPELGLDANYILHGETVKDAVAGMLKNFGPRLKELRGRRSVAAFAKATNIPAEEVGRLERGERPPTRQEALSVQLAHPQYSASWVLGGAAPTLDGELDQLEIVLIRNYRASGAEGQDLLRRQAAMLADRAAKESGR